MRGILSNLQNTISYFARSLFPWIDESSYFIFGFLIRKLDFLICFCGDTEVKIDEGENAVDPLVQILERVY